MKKLVLTTLLTITTSVFYAQEDAKKDVQTVSHDSIEMMTPVSQDTLALSNTTKKKLLIEADFDKSMFLFRGRKSKREKLC